MLKNSKIVPFWIFTMSVIMLLIVSQLVQHGAFMDGMLYVSVSKNLAIGHGSFWNLNFSQTFLPEFHEQPPLYFGLLSLFYKAFGTSMYVERFFCLLCFVVTIFLIHKLWKKIYFTNPDISKNSWLPVLIFTTIPVCFWAYINHVEETVMSIFTLASVYFLYGALFLNEKIVRNILLSGFFIFLATLTKGIQGAFPLVSIVLYWLIIKKLTFKKTIAYSLLLLSVPIIIYGLLCITNKQVVYSIQHYFETRLVRTFNQVGSTTENHFTLLWTLFQELLPIVLITFLFLYFTKKYREKKASFNMHHKISLWFVCIGLSGALPLMVTLEQRGFYLVTTIPFFVLAISMQLSERVSTLINKIQVKTLKFKIATVLVIALFISSVLFSASQIGHYKRDEALLKDIDAIASIVPKRDIINMPIEMANDWSMMCYFVRYYDISLEYRDTLHPYFILRKDLALSLVPKQYVLLPLPTKELNLYKRLY